MAEYEYIKYIIRNKEPLRIADDSTSQNGQTVTLRYIPGTTMRGYIINKMAPSSDFEQLKEELFSEQVKYLNAYLCVKEKNNEKNSRVRFKTLVPSPKGFYENKKEVDGKKQIENVVINGAFTGGYKRASLGRYCYIQDNCVYYYNVSTASDMKIKIDQKGTEEQSVFRNEYIEKNHYFTGFIAVKQHETAEKIKKLFEKELILGNARSSGFGKCEVVSCELIKELPYQEYLPCEDQKNDCYMMLLSNTVLRNRDGELCGFTPEMVAELGRRLEVDDLKIQYCSTSTVNVRGYNRTWGIRLPSMTAYESGSVFHLTFSGVLTLSKMQKIVESGIGIRRNSGFGTVMFLKDYEGVRYKEARKYFEDTDKEARQDQEKQEDTEKVIKIVARKYYRNMLARKLEAYINEVGAGKKESFCDIRTSSSQLGTIDSILTARKYDPQKAKEALIQYLQHENEKADKNSAHKGHNSLKKMEKFVQEAIFAKGLDEIAGFSGKEPGKIMGISTSELLSKDEEDRMKLKLIVDLIRFKNKEEK